MADYLELYVKTFNLPVHFDTGVKVVRPVNGGYRVETDSLTYTADQVVVATGPFQCPYLPPFADRLAPSVVQLHAAAYRHPGQLTAGPVLVVGGGNSGAQIAAELAPSRTVYLSLGRRQPYMPQRLLGRDLFWWLYRLGVMDITVDSRLGQALRRRDPIIGTNLKQLVRRHRLELVGRAIDADNDSVIMSDGRRLKVPNVIWATGFRPDYEWLDVHVFDERRWPRHKRGISSAPGLYFIGLPWQQTRGSALLGGVGRDAAFLAANIATVLDAPDQNPVMQHSSALLIS